MNGAGLFDMFDQLLADELGVDIETYVETIEKFDEEEMVTIIETLLDQSTTKEQKDDVKNLFKSKL